jgi:hypothetical protein
MAKETARIPGAANNVELPVPEDDGAADHLPGRSLPAVELPTDRTARNRRVLDPRDWRCSVGLTRRSQQPRAATATLLVRERHREQVTGGRA